MQSRLPFSMAGPVSLAELKFMKAPFKFEIAHVAYRKLLGVPTTTIALSREV